MLEAYEFNFNFLTKQRLKHQSRGVDVE